MKQNQKLEIDLTFEDLQELIEGRVFNWTYPTDKGESIDIKLFNEEAE